MPNLPLLLLLPPLMLASALCSATETALFSLSRTDRLRLGRLKPSAAAATSTLLAEPRSLLITILLLTNISNVSYLVVSSVIAFDTGDTGESVGLAGAVFSLFSVLGLILFTDLLPKLLARRLRVEFCRVFARPAVSVFRIVSPVRRFFELGVIGPLSRLARPHGRGSAPAVSLDELTALIEMSARQGVFDVDEQRLLEDVVQLRAIRVRDEMTPRIDMPWIDIDAGRDELIAIVRETGLNAVPACRGTLDGEIVGWVDCKRFLAATWNAGESSAPRLADFLRPVLFVPERARLDQLLEQFRATKRYMAMCVDEYGSVVGMIDIDDITRRLLSPAGDDGEPSLPGIETLGPGRWLIPGRLGVRDLAEFFDRPGLGTVTVTGRQWTGSAGTVAGLMLRSLGRVPQVGDEIRFGNIRLLVQSMRARAIESVVISLVTDDGADS